MVLSNLKRITKEDFPSQDQDLVDKLAYVLNPFLDQIQQAFQKQITTTDNLSRELTTVSVVTVAGTPTPKTQIKTALKNIAGITVISAVNATNSGTYPTTAPFVSWSLSGNIITLNNVTGLQDNNKYNLTLEVIS